MKDELTDAEFVDAEQEQQSIPKISPLTVRGSEDQFTFFLGGARIKTPAGQYRVFHDFNTETPALAIVTVRSGGEAYMVLLPAGRDFKEKHPGVVLQCVSLQDANDKVYDFRFAFIEVGDLEAQARAVGSDQALPEQLAVLVGPEIPGTRRETYIRERIAFWLENLSEDSLADWNRDAEVMGRMATPPKKHVPLTHEDAALTLASLPDSMLEEIWEIVDIRKQAKGN